MKAYLDTSAVLDLLDRSGIRYLAAQKAIETEVRTWCISDLVRLECLVRPLRLKDNDAESEVRTVLGSIDCLSLVSSVFDDAAKLRADFGLRTPDAIHLAAALHHGCEEFWTNDEKLTKASVDITFRRFE